MLVAKAVFPILEPSCHVVEVVEHRRHSDGPVLGLGCGLRHPLNLRKVFRDRGPDLSVRDLVHPGLGITYQIGYFSFLCLGSLLYLPAPGGQVTAGCRILHLLGIPSCIDSGADAGVGVPYYICYVLGLVSGDRRRGDVSAGCPLSEDGIVDGVVPLAGEVAGL
jgi:hypothetical protein